MSEDETGYISGFRIDLDEQRFVWVGKDDDCFYLRFSREGHETKVKLSLEAAQALHQLLSGHFPGEGRQILEIILDKLPSQENGGWRWFRVVADPK
jgi:hypothetical protein